MSVKFEMIELMAAEWEWAAMEEAAQDAGLSLASFVRRAAVREALRVLRRR